MKKTVIFLLVLFTNSMFGLAQSVVVTLEAEAGELTLPAKQKSVNGYSGNAYVGDNDPGSAIVFHNVNIQDEGTYEFRTYYTSMHIRSVAIQSGNFPKVICTCPESTPDWNAPPVSQMVTYIYLNAGMNTITVTPHNGGGPNIDKFEIVSTTVSMPRPEPEKITVAYDLTDDAIVTTNRTAVNIENITDNDEFTVYSFTESSAEIQIECDMPYLITGYLFSAGAVSTQNVSNWKLEYSTDGNIYTLLSPTQTDVFDNGKFFHISRVPHTDRFKAAKYYRITAYGGQIGEIQLFGIPYMTNSDNKNFPIDITTGIDIHTKVLGDPPGVYVLDAYDERCYNLFDRDMSRKYYWSNARIFNVEVELPVPVALSYYTLTSCQDYPERDPESWVVEGFEMDWEPVSEVSGFTFPTRYATMKFVCESDKKYRGYRLRTINNNGADAFQLLKWQLFSDTYVSDPTINADDVLVYSTAGNVVIHSLQQAVYSIVNLSGQLVATGSISTDVEQHVKLLPGIYIVRLVVGNNSVVNKIIVK